MLAEPPPDDLDDAGFLLASHVIACVVAAAVAVALWREAPLPFCAQVVLDVALFTSVCAGAVPVLHEGPHAALYALRGRGPRLRRNGEALVVTAGRPVSRRLLWCQLRIVPCAAVVLTVLTAGALGRGAGLAPGRHAAAVCAAAGMFMIWSGWKDLGKAVFRENRDVAWFWDRGSAYPPAPAPDDGAP